VDYVYGVLTTPAGEEEELVVLPIESAEDLAEITALLRSQTWGELRANASPERYRELLTVCGYGEFADLAADLPIGLGVRAALEAALAEFDPHAVPPGDSEPFDPHSVESDAGGEYPPDPHYLQNLHVASDVVDRWGERYQTSRNLTCAMLRADGLTAVISSLEADGHTCREDADLIRAGFPW
jgi:hypothetical protein